MDSSSNGTPLWKGSRSGPSGDSSSAFCGSVAESGISESASMHSMTDCARYCAYFRLKTIDSWFR
jgi:hypothetical protein